MKAHLGLGGGDKRGSGTLERRAGEESTEIMPQGEKAREGLLMRKPREREYKDFWSAGRSPAPAGLSSLLPAEQMVSQTGWFSTDRDDRPSGGDGRML